MRYLVFHLAIVFTCGVVRNVSGSPVIQLNRHLDSVAWVDSVYQSLTTAGRIAQLMNIRTYSNKDEAYNLQIDEFILRYNIGGLTFFQGGPLRQAHLTNRWQNLAATPLLIALDAETGPGMRLDSIMNWPNLMTLGALQDESLIEDVGVAIGQQCRYLGVHINFAPVADVNNNPRNPVINQRSFGENPIQVAKLTGLMARGIQRSGTIATLKHFPGHGDTDKDSHYTLPVIKKEREVLFNNELVPFRENLEITDAVMTAHLFMPSFDSTPDLPASLSPRIVNDLLRKQMGYNGLIITDALDMKGADRFSRPGEKELMAFLAGNDILLLPTEIPAAINRISEAIDSGVVPYTDLETRCRRVLSYKYKVGLSARKPVETNGLIDRLNNPAFDALNNKVFEGALTVTRNDGLVPVNASLYNRIAYVPVYGGHEVFSTQMELFFPHDCLPLPDPSDSVEANLVFEKLNEYDLIIMAVFPPSEFASRNYGLTPAAIQSIKRIGSRGNVISVVFGNPYSAGMLGIQSSKSAVMVAYQSHPAACVAAARALYGAIPFNGRLPVSMEGNLPAGHGMETTALQVLGFAHPEAVGLLSDKLARVDEIAQEGIDKGAFPGCQVLIARHGKVVYYKSFGFQDVSALTRVKTTDLYDLASLTKVMGTTLAVMKLHEDGSLKIRDELGDYLLRLKARKVRHATIEDVLYHQAGFFPWLPYYKATLQNGEPGPAYYRNLPGEGFDIPVAKNLYLRNDYPDTILHIIDGYKISHTGHYQYSDMGFILLRYVIEQITKTPFAAYLETAFFRKMGLSSMVFNPLEWYPASRITPTLLDTEFRKQLLRGYVHDPAAAMLGGVSGHAGLFSHAFDVARVLQMLMWDGQYNGETLFSAETVRWFTSAQNNGRHNRRGLGFDKPPVVYKPNGPVCKSASALSYGHSGFTGTYMWADPSNGLIYVFLSNRIHPSDENNLINVLNIRTRIHQAAYDAIEYP